MGHEIDAAVTESHFVPISLEP
ncbi:hypothetical protein FAGKG844_40186 [Frankia sp. AgKG'84/4]